MDNQKISWPGWETVRLIGQGSFGTVYEIQRQVFDDTEKAALKVISIPQNHGDIEEMLCDGYDEESITSTFQSHLKSIVAEYSLTRKMNDCVNIVSCDDVRYVQHDDGIGWDIFIKMELLTPLTKVLTGQPSEDAVIKLGLDMCNALEECRKHDVIHRDIKPQNIFVSAKGDYKLGDFGIAKTVEKTMGGTKIGTYKYMAPEVYNNQPYGHSADIYSLGMVLYWLLNYRRHPFLPLPPEKLKAGMEEEARHRRMSGQPLCAPACGSELLKTIVLKACAFDPTQRYQTPAQMRKDLLAVEYEWKVQHPEQSGMQICPACGSVTEENCRFCIFCGSPMVVPPEEQELVEELTATEWPEKEETAVTAAEKTLPKEEMPAIQVPAGKTPAEEPVAEEPTEEPEVQLPAEEPEVQLPTEEPKQEIVILDKWVKVPEPEAVPEETPAPPAEETPAEETPVEEVPPPAPVAEICANCGAELIPDNSFCIYCGAKRTPKPAPSALEAKPAAEEPVPAPAEEEKAPQRLCAQCGSQVAEDAVFCTQCGTRYESAPVQPEPEPKPEPEDRCKGCGAKLLPGDRFCIYCGTRV